MPGPSLAQAAVPRRRFRATERPKNVLIVILESTRATSLVPYDPAARAGRALVPLAAEMTLFEHIYAPAPTSAHALFSIFYGVYPYVGGFWMGGDKVVVADSMAQVFARAGYATQFYITGDLDFDDVRSFAARGFERVLDSNAWPGQEAYAMLPWGRDDRLLTDEVKHFLSTRDERPFFLVAMTSNPHHPYAIDQLPGQAPEADPRAAYDRLVDYDIALLTDLYGWMKTRGIADDTLLVVLGDHGEAFGEHPGNFGHSASIYEENTHIPCFILHPRRLGLPPRIAQLGSEVDLRATILDITGVAETQPGDGMSLLFEDAARPVFNFTENGISRFGMRDGDFTYIYTPHVDGEKLFDRRSDPGEARELGADAMATTERYRVRLQQWEGQHQLRLATVLRERTASVRE